MGVNAAIVKNDKKVFSHAKKKLKKTIVVERYQEDQEDANLQSPKETTKRAIECENDNHLQRST